MSENFDFVYYYRYVRIIPRDSQDGAFYRAILAIHHENYEEAQMYINSARDILDTELTAMAGESYQRAYGAMVFVQMLSELEEVIQYKIIPERRATLRTMWWERLQAGQRLAEDWQKIIQVHSLVLTPQEDMHTWLKYASICRKSGSFKLSHKTLVMLMGYDPSLHRDSALMAIDPQINFAYCKHLWASGEKQLAYEQLTRFYIDFYQQEKNDDVTQIERRKLLARCYMKLGQWQHNLDGVTEASIPNILKCYLSATEYDNEWYKAWHAWAYMNFETVLFYKQQNEQNARALNQPVRMEKRKEVVNYIIMAVRGFFKSITLSKGSSLQDTLR